MKENKQMRTKILSKALLSLGLILVVGSAITQVRGEEDKLPLVTIHSTGDVTRGKTGAFVVNMNPPLMFGPTYVNFSVGGTAGAGVDYVALVSPALIDKSGYGVILVKTLSDTRVSHQALSVVIKLEPGPGYVLGQSKSAQMMIKP
jgi:hypothetical protein